MSIRRFASRVLDNAAVARVRLVPKERRGEFRFCPVLHVEQLDHEACFDNLLEYVSAYQNITGKRAVATVMTPISPLTAARLEVSRFDPKEYARRIAEVGRVAIIGQHGHFVRPAPDDEIRPMHASFFDADAIERQIRFEGEWLTERGLMDPQRKIYTAGWWFMNSWLQQLLIRLGYRHDFSISLSKHSYSHAAWIEQRRSGGRGGAIRFDGSTMTGAAALSGAAGAGRPLLCFKRLVAEGLLRSGAGAATKYLTFYGHDYDLPPAEAIAAAQALSDLGFGFFEPEELETAI